MTSDVRVLLADDDRLVRETMRLRLANSSLRAALAAAQEELLQARELLLEQAHHDGLTGLLNRRAAEEELERELRRAARGGGPFGVVLLDLDRFESINDTWGHPVGDRVLAGTAEVLRTVLRAEDLVARWGGEEFFVLLPEVDLDGAAAAAERIRTAILDTPFHLPQGVLHVTASLGVGAVPQGGRSREELLAAVDAALYRAKERSRNCVVLEAPTAPRRPMLVSVVEAAPRSTRIA